MKAWRIHSPGNLTLDELPPAQALSKYAKIKLSYSALSTSDRLIFEGKLAPKSYPLTLGRQGVGMVTEVGDEVTNVARGDRVFIDPYIFCDSCMPCREGKFTDCVDPKTYGVHEDGFLSDFAVVRSGDLFKLPERVKDTEAIFAGHVALAMNIITRLNLEKGEHLVIMGASVVGLILAQAAMYYQAVPILIDTRQDRLNIAENLGVYYCVNSVDEDVAKKIFSLTGGNMAEAMCYLSFDESSLNRGFEFVAPNGRVAIAGWSSTKPELSASFLRVFSRQLSVFGISNGAKLIPSAINMLANKRVNTAPLATKEIPFDKVADAIKDQIAYPNKDVKVLIKI